MKRQPFFAKITLFFARLRARRLLHRPPPTARHTYGSAKGTEPRRRSAQKKTAPKGGADKG